MADTTGELLKDFRRNPDYDLVVPGNRDGEQVYEHLQLIKDKYPEMIKYMPLFERNQGVFGNPKMHKFDVGNFDVPVILHIYYLALTMKYFGSLEKMRICEIGPGAGLMFKLITDLWNNVAYTFIDLPGPLYINKKHAEHLGRECNVVEYLPCNTILNEPIEREYDLVMSDCAFNELDRDVQSVYIDKILNHSKRGRIACYDAKIELPEVKPFDIYGIFRLIKHPSKIIKMDLRVPSIYWGKSKHGL
jgi:hypothetical protein